MKHKKLSLTLILLLILTILCGCSTNDFINSRAPEETRSAAIHVEGLYSAPKDVANYIHAYNDLPDNYITKKDAIALGWKSDEGNLWEVSDQLSIGGDVFGNREGKLPRAKGRKWYECDVNYKGGFRGSERVVYSNDGLIYYTNDHYESFTQLY
ncbi:ribonuclease domain-containing protein [Cohnella sp. WQ 127256]|uniref:ribonuclease domain-containing protein n=1 Tax=Cohnella sp. WQ 127256 TaxID=2938790 RepID=UPI00211771C2|nr:ribonuclease domain-containing protein [Cohnella sp. WQ 127256]